MVFTGIPGDGKKWDGTGMAGKSRTGREWWETGRDFKNHLPKFPVFSVSSRPSRLDSLACINHKYFHNFQALVFGLEIKKLLKPDADDKVMGKNWGKIKPKMGHDGKTGQETLWVDGKRDGTGQEGPRKERDGKRENEKTSRNTSDNVCTHFRIPLWDWEGNIYII